MPVGLTAARQPQAGIAETAFERHALVVATCAPATGAVVANAGVAAGFGDGTVRIFAPGAAPRVVAAHRGAVLALAVTGDGRVLSGGDDGRFLQIGADGEIVEIASFGSRWVDCVAARADVLACSSGRTVHLFAGDRSRSAQLEHPSTIGGLAFARKRMRLAVSHYGGVTVWEDARKRWKATRLVWKGSHGDVSFSPDDRFVVTSMQEHTLHGWRLRDKADMRMAGYPARIKSFAWIGDRPFLATSGADEAICWPFAGRNGPMGAAPEQCGRVSQQLCTAVTGLLGVNGVFAGFRDGTVMAGRPDSEQGDVVVRNATGSAVTTMAVTPDGWLFIGDEAGQAVWGRLRPEVTA